MASANSFVTVYEFCRRTGMVPSQVYEALALGKIKGHKHGAGRRKVWRIPESEALRVAGARPRGEDART